MKHFICLLPSYSLAQRVGDLGLNLHNYWIKFFQWQSHYLSKFNLDIMYLIFLPLQRDRLNRWQIKQNPVY